MVVEAPSNLALCLAMSMSPLFLVVLLATSLVSAASVPNTYYVAPGGDDGSADPTDPAWPLATIGAALSMADTGSLINLAPGMYEETDLRINVSVGLIGAGQNETVIQGGATPGTAADRIFWIDSGSDVYFSGMTIKNGVARAASLNGANGGGFYNAGSNLYLNDVKLCGHRTEDGGFGGAGGYHGGGFMSLSNSFVMQNFGGDGCNGGGLAIAGGLASISDTRFDQNLAGDEPTVGAPGVAGGIYIGPGTWVELTNSSLTDNCAGNGVDGAGGNGGGISNQGQLFIHSTTFHNNKAGDGGSGLSGANGGFGGHIINFSEAEIFCSTFVGGMAGHSGPNSGFGGSGGAIDATSASGITKLSFCTVTDNVAGDGFFGGGFGGGFHVNFGSIKLRFQYTIVDDNLAGSGGGGPDVAGSGIQSLGHNVIGIDSFSIANPGLGDWVGVDPLLGPLADNGGPTHTRLPSGGSPILGQVPLMMPLLDQRGYERANPTAPGAADPDAAIPAIAAPGLFIARFGELIRLKLDQTSSSMTYQVFQAPTVERLSWPIGTPGGPFPLSSPTQGTDGPMRFDIPSIGPLQDCDGDQTGESYFKVRISF